MFEPGKLKEIVGEPALRALDDPTVAHLLGAAELVRKHGLTKYERQSAKGSFCVHGALAMAAYGDPSTYGPKEGSAASEVYRVLTARGTTSIRPHDVSAWNNLPERTASEVIEVLECAALSRARALRDAP